MKIKTLLAAGLLALAPTLTLAQGCNSEHQSQEAMSCAEGMKLDTATGTCVPLVTG